MYVYMGGCQNWGPFLGTLNHRCRIIIGTQKRTIILTTTQYKYIYIYIHGYMMFKKLLLQIGPRVFLFESACLLEYDFPVTVGLPV